MIKIAITPEQPLNPQLEAARIAQLLLHGWDRVHLRHPQATAKQLSQVLSLLPEELHPGISIHDHFQLLSEFNRLGGIHLNHRNPCCPDGFGKILSRSYHSLAELVKYSAQYDYLTLSPVFNSTSKRDYHAAFTPEELTEVGKIKPLTCVALGGVTPEKIPMLAHYGFKGYAVLGAIPWKCESESEFIDKINQFH